MNLMTIVLSGGTGFIGKALVKRLLEAGHTVMLLSRRPERSRQSGTESLQIISWDGRTLGAWVQGINGADAVINLAGETIAEKRWTAAQKAKILKSRIEATRALVSAIAQVKKRPSVLVNASAVGYYGDVESGDVTESHPKGKGFLADVCEQWEQEARKAEALGVRVVLLRTGIVLEKEGGALAKMLPPFKLFIGGPLGCGRQWIPWVHREDVIGAILFALERSRLSGAVNVTAPEPATMKQFCAALGKVIHRPSWAPVPAFALQVLLGEMSEMLLTGQRAIPQKLETSGYRFRYPNLEETLRAIFST